MPNIVTELFNVLRHRFKIAIGYEHYYNPNLFLDTFKYILSFLLVVIYTFYGANVILLASKLHMLTSARFVDVSSDYVAIKRKK